MVELFAHKKDKLIVITITLVFLLLMAGVVAWYQVEMQDISEKLDTIHNPVVK